MKRDKCNDRPPSHFEIEALFRDNEQLSVVLRGHLYVEHFLTLVLSRALPDPDTLDVFDLRFPLKVDLAAALRVISIEEQDALKAINRIRNRFAHEPRAWFSDNDAGALWQTLSPRVRDKLANAGRHGPQDFDLALDFFKYSIIAICYILAEQFQNEGKAESKA
jgi:hypothetical protein